MCAMIERSSVNARHFVDLKIRKYFKILYNFFDLDMRPYEYE